MPLDSQLLLAWIDQALSEILMSDAHDLDVALMALEQAKFHILEESPTPRRKVKRKRKGKNKP